MAAVSDAATAQAVRSAHEGLGEAAALVEEMPRVSLADHLVKHRKRQARAVLKAVEAVPNVSPMRRRKPA